ncbi:MAG: ATPase, T2SS/T4P/T4SS family, partial [bacterium]
AALTGHLVLSTLHTNDSAGAVTRLADMEIEQFLISTAVLGVMAQRLVSKGCPDCKDEYPPKVDIPKSASKYFGTEGNNKQPKFYRGRGCKRCRNSGYRGRISIMEVLPMTDRIRNLVIKSASADGIKDAAVAEGMRTLMEDGWIKVAKGITTVEEVMRVTNIE